MSRSILPDLLARIQQHERWIKTLRDEGQQFVQRGADLHVDAAPVRMAVAFHRPLIPFVWWRACTAFFPPFLLPVITSYHPPSPLHKSYPFISIYYRSTPKNLAIFPNIRYNCSYHRLSSQQCVPCNTASFQLFTIAINRAVTSQGGNHEPNIHHHKTHYHCCHNFFYFTTQFYSCNNSHHFESRFFPYNHFHPRTQTPPDV